MKSARKKKEKLKENVNTIQPALKKSTKCLKERRSKSVGNDEPVLSGKEVLSKPSSAFSSHIQNLSNTVIITGHSDYNSVTVLHPSAKIKLQLFPADERVRIGMEKDGYNPYLELTLSARKRISSVLKHLGKKWGSSSIAQGELMLFTHDVVMENLGSYGIWTLNDTSISAGDVYKAVGSPAIFRLRYGWFIKQSRFCVPPVSDSFQPVKKPELVEKDRSVTLETEGDTEHRILVEDDGSKGPTVTLMAERATENQTPVEANELKRSNTTEVATVPLVEPCSTESSAPEEPNMDYGFLQSSTLLSDLSYVSIGGLLSEASLQGKPNQPTTLLSDLSNISIGALLSEASLQGKPNQPSTLPSNPSHISIGAFLSEASLQGKPNQPSTLLSDLSYVSIGGLLSEASLQGKPNFFDTKLNGSRSAFSQLFTDSLDAFVNNQLKSAQDPKVSHNLPSSIFDTEVACDSFSFQKSSASPKEFSGLAESDTSGACRQDVVPERNRCFKMDELSHQERTKVDITEQGVRTDSLVP